MINIPNLLISLGKKGIKGFAKNKASENNNIDELFKLTSYNPFKAKELNKGEEEGIHERNEKLKTQKDDEFKSNQSKISTIQTPLNQEFKQTPTPEEPYYKKQIRDLELNKQNTDNYNSIMKAIEENNNPKEDILYKHSSQIPESELKESMGYAGYETQDPELKRKLQEKHQNWFEYYYSTNPIKQDTTGRNINPEAKFKFPNDVIEAQTKDNSPMSQAFIRVAERTAPFSIKSLQKGLNNIYANDYKKQKLKEDNDIGPKTTSRMKEALANFGVDNVNNNIGLGAFTSLVEDNRKKPVDNESLKNTITSIKPNDGGSFLQRGLNKQGASLKEDNDIGPKTTSSFNQIKEEKEDDLISYFKKSLF